MFSIICYEENYIEEIVNTKYFGLQIYNHLNWKNNIERMICKSSRAYYAVRLTIHISNINSLKSIYCAYCHCVIKY